MFRCLPPWPVGSCDLPPRVWLRPFQPSSLPTQHLQEYDPQSQKCPAGAWPGRAAGHLCCLFCCLWCVCVCVIVPCSLPPLTQPSLWSWSQGTPAPSSSSSSPTACVKAGPLGKSIMGEPPALPRSLVGCAVGDSLAVPPPLPHTHTPAGWQLLWHTPQLLSSLALPCSCQSLGAPRLHALSSRGRGGADPGFLKLAPCLGWRVGLRTRGTCRARPCSLVPQCGVWSLSLVAVGRPRWP